NLEAADPCRVDDRPQSVLLSPDGRGLLVELSGAQRAANDAAVSAAEPKAPSEESAAPGESRVATHVAERHLLPAARALRNELFSARLPIPPGCRTKASLSSPGALALVRLAAPGKGRTVAASSAGLPSPRQVRIEPGPARELVFSWSQLEQGSAPVEAQVG